MNSVLLPLLFLAASGSSNIHGDADGSNTHPVRGPEGPRIEVSRFRYGRMAGECAGFAFDSRGRVVTVCAKAGRSEILLLDPATLDVLARQSLPPRKGTISRALRLDFEGIFKDTSGGSYFCMDRGDRVVVATAERDLRVVAITEGPGFREEARFDLSQAVPEGDRLTSALPGLDGYYWFVSRQGRVGTVDPATGATHVLATGEEIENSFLTSADGTYVVSDHALYRLRASGDGTPEVIWRRSYDRGIRAKPGQVNQGSGTTPTLLGPYVVIADNAEPREHVLVFRRESARLVCEVPVFEPGRSALENSVIAHGNSLVVENTYGYRNPFARSEAAGGMARIDIAPDGSGCHEVWSNSIVSPSTVAKLSVPSRLIYGYGYDPRARGKREWSLFSLDYDTGEVRDAWTIGAGRAFDNSWASIALGPAPGEAWIGNLTGFVRVHESN